MLSCWASFKSFILYLVIVIEINDSHGVFSGCSRCSMHTQQSLRSTDVIINQYRYAFSSTFINSFTWHVVSVYFSSTFKIN